MSIKQRLVISNILMIVVPVAVALILLFGCNELYWRLTRGLYATNYLYWRLTYRSAVRIINIVTVGGVLLSVLLANYYLTKYVFRKVRAPLDKLSDCIHKIEDGHLESRIADTGNDEFTEVFTDFNEMADRLQASVASLERQEENRRELLMNISHDLRSPLTSVKAYVEGLLDGVAATPEAQKQYLLTIRDKAGEIDRMVNKIFLFSKLDCDAFTGHPEPLPLDKELPELLSVLKPEYVEKGLDITFSCDGPATVTADPDLFERAVVNIVDNACKYKGEGPGKLDIRLSRGNGLCSLTFSDNGPGVSPEALPHLFEVFYREDPARSSTRKGSGLGLAIVAKAVSRMNGTVRAYNRPEGGLTVQLTLPETEERHA